MGLVLLDLALLGLVLLNLAHYACQLDLAQIIRPIFYWTLLFWN
jgi:hypothetical protein